MVASGCSITWRPEAPDDLRIMIRCIAQGQPARARTFGKRSREKVLPLARHPLPSHEGRPGLPAGVLELVLHPNCIAFHRLLDASGTVEILRAKPMSQQAP